MANSNDEVMRYKVTAMFHRDAEQHHKQMKEHFEQKYAELVKEDITHPSKQPNLGKEAATPSKLAPKKVNGVEKRERKGKQDQDGLNKHRDDLKVVK